MATLIGEDQIRKAAPTRNRPGDLETSYAHALGEDLRQRIDGEVRFDDGSRALYATDGSNYRQVPIGVVVPKTIEDVVATVEHVPRLSARRCLARGGGTSLAGQCCNVAVVLDFSKYLNQILELDPQAQAAPRAAGHRARLAAQGSREASSDVRSRSRHAQPQHARRHDRQQLLRHPFGDGGQDRWTISTSSMCSPTTALRMRVGADQRRRARAASFATAGGAARSTRS